jgi:hypothetical protein
VLVRWESAAPVRQAFARLAQLDAKAAAEYQGAAPRLPEDSYVITVKMAESSQPAKDLFAAPEENPRWEATLKTQRGIIAATQTQYSGVGAGAAAHFFFPRTLEGAPLFGGTRERVEFAIKGEQLTIRSKFTVDAEFLR